MTPKQKAWADAYMICLNATEAARTAGYSGDDKALASRGYENVRKREIRAYMDDVLTEQAMSKAEVLGRLAAMARGDIGDFIDPESMTVNLRTAKARGISHLVKKLKQTIILNEKTETQTEIFEFELHDPQSALVHLGKAHGLFKDKQEWDGTLAITWQEPIGADDDIGIGSEELPNTHQTT